VSHPNILLITPPPLNEIKEMLNKDIKLKGIFEMIIVLLNAKCI